MRANYTCWPFTTRAKPRGAYPPETWRYETPGLPLPAAGIHFVGVMRALGVHDALQPRFRTAPNGATAMRELGPRSIIAWA